MDLSVDARIASIGPFAPSGGAPALVPLAGGGAAPAKPQECQTPEAPQEANLDNSIALIRAFRNVELDFSGNIAQASITTQAFWVYMVWDHHPWDWKNVAGHRYADYGNFFYGATGRAAGFTGLELILGSAAAQWMFGGPKGGPLGDNPDDPPVVKAGVRYFDMGCWR